MDIVLSFLVVTVSISAAFFGTLYSGTSHPIAQAAAAGFGCAAAYFWALSVMGYLNLDKTCPSVDESSLERLLQFSCRSHGGCRRRLRHALTPRDQAFDGWELP
jgi:hypothetical protein